MSNIITSIGVLFILIAFFGNVTNRISKNKLYFWLNAIGSILAGVGAFLVQLWPIVLLEFIWATVSIYEINILNKSKNLKK